jgi:hypothetical protein
MEESAMDLDVKQHPRGRLPIPACRQFRIALEQPQAWPVPGQ